MMAMEDRFQDHGVGRSHTSLPKINIPSRWNTFTDGSAAAKHDSKSSGVQQRHNAHRRHHRHHHAKDTIQSAVQLQNPFSFDTYNPLKRNHTSTHNNGVRRSQETSRRNSQGEAGGQSHGQSQQQENEVTHPEAQDATNPLKRVVRPEDVVRERKRRERRAEEVAEALKALSRDAHTATRKLDDTYYALLEQLGALRATISSLRELSDQAVVARKEWNEDVESASKEVQAKVESFGGFAEQEKTVNELVQRLKDGKEKSGDLEKRLENCRSRLENFQHKELEDRITVYKRWRICWVTLASMVLFIVLLVVWKHQRGEPDLLQELKAKSEAIKEKGAELAIEVGVLDEDTFNKTKPGVRLVNEELEKQQRQEDYKWQRILDEL